MPSPAEPRDALQSSVLAEAGVDDENGVTVAEERYRKADGSYCRVWRRVPSRAHQHTPYRVGAAPTAGRRRAWREACKR